MNNRTHEEPPIRLACSLGEFAAGMRFGSVPAAAIKTAKAAITDCIAVIVAGCNEEPVQILRKTLAAQRGIEESTLYFSGERTSGPHAAWINSAAGHVLDYDDFAKGHPSVVIVPAILAEAEALNASGADLITAYIVGYEVWIELATRERGSYQTKGLHPTALIGPLAAAAACANLRRLNAASAMSALGLAAAQASGLTIGHGTMVKSVQVGRAAYTGVLSARLAANGMTTSEETLDHERGFLRAISPTGDVDTESAPQLGRRWHILEQGLSVKRYPVCYRAHRIIDATLGLMEARQIDIDNIEKIEAMLSKIDAMMLKNHQPVTAMAAKFSVEFAVASALHAGNVGLAQVKDEYVRRPEVQDLMRRVAVVTNENYDLQEPGFSVYDQVRVYLRAGETVESEQVRYALGNAKRPLAADALREKFLDCLAAGNPGLDANRLLQELYGLENVVSCRVLTEPMIAAPRLAAST